MPVWKMSGGDYAKVKASERFHFIHENATTRAADGCHHMTFSRNVAMMLRRDLGIGLEEIIVRDASGRARPLDHPPDAVMIPHEELRATALNAPGFNLPKP